MHISPCQLYDFMWTQCLESGNSIYHEAAAWSIYQQQENVNNNKEKWKEEIPVQGDLPEDLLIENQKTMMDQNQTYSLLSQKNEQHPQGDHDFPIQEHPAGI